MRLLINCLGHTKMWNVICHDLFLRFHLGFSTDNLFAVSGERDERFHHVKFDKNLPKEKETNNVCKIRWTLKKHIHVSKQLEHFL